MELSVVQVARLAGVSEEAVRRSLREGRLSGRRVLVGERLVWVVDEGSVALWRPRRGGVPVPSVPGSAGPSSPVSLFDGVAGASSTAVAGSSGSSGGSSGRSGFEGVLASTRAVSPVLSLVGDRAGVPADPAVPDPAVPGVSAVSVSSEVASLRAELDAVRSELVRVGRDNTRLRRALAALVDAD